MTVKEHELWILWVKGNTDFVFTNQVYNVNGWNKLTEKNKAIIWWYAFNYEL